MTAVVIMNAEYNTTTASVVQGHLIKVSFVRCKIIQYKMTRSAIMFVEKTSLKITFNHLKLENILDQHRKGREKIGVLRSKLSR